MTTIVLKVENLQVTVGGKVVLSEINFQLERGGIVALTGANGSGKSSLAQALMGDARYNVTTNQQTNKRKILFDGKDLVKMSVDERARAGLFVGWQSPVAIPGLSIFSLCKAAYEAQGKKIDKLIEFKRRVEELASQVGLCKEYVDRGVNEGFSGGEKKRLELLQLLVLKPKIAILDEIDSGLDADGVKRLVTIINEMKGEGVSFVLITHNKRLLSDVEIDETWEIKHGRVQTGL